MSSATEEDEFAIPPPDLSRIVTEDDTPVDNIFSERQMRLLVESLYASWQGPGEGRTFVAMANVGLFSTEEQTTLVPDVLVSLDVQLPDDPFPKANRSYMIWRYGKPPEVVIEIVSNRKGDELGDKLLDYARLGVAYYVVWDPEGHLSPDALQIFVRQGARLIKAPDGWLPDVGLGLLRWQGAYEGMEELWLRWRDTQGQLLLTGIEAAAAARDHAKAEQERAEAERVRAETERVRAEAERERAEAERQRFEQERQRAEALAAKLRALGIDPDA